jgi:hypothetical protein
MRHGKSDAEIAIEIGIEKMVFVGRGAVPALGCNKPQPASAAA